MIYQSIFFVNTNFTENLLHFQYFFFGVTVMIVYFVLICFRVVMHYVEFSVWERCISTVLAAVNLLVYFNRVIRNAFSSDTCK